MRSIVTQLLTQPTSVIQLLQWLPLYVGYSDACKLGVGGVCVGGMKKLTPFLWLIELPQDIKYFRISDANPQGRIAISDPELSGLLLNLIALESLHLPLELEYIGNFYDNRSELP